MLGLPPSSSDEEIAAQLGQALDEHFNAEIHTAEIGEGWVEAKMTVEQLGETAAIEVADEAPPY